MSVVNVIQLPHAGEPHLSPQHTTVRAIILGADLPHDVVHRPPVQLLVGDHRERYAILQDQKLI